MIPIQRAVKHIFPTLSCPIDPIIHHRLFPATFHSTSKHLPQPNPPCTRRVNTPKTRLTETPGKGWGLRAEQDLEVGETLAVIPRSLCLGLAHEAAEGEGEIGGRIDDAWTGPPCVQALVGQVPEEFADVRQVNKNPTPPLRVLRLYFSA